MRKIEYKTIKIHTKKGFLENKLEVEKVDQELNVLGAMGWDLVSVNDMEVSGSSYTFYYTFKRETN